MTRRIKTALLAVSLGFVIAGAEFEMAVLPGLVPGNAEARVGRPLTPGSVAGVARRTTRRTVRRSTIYATTLPTTCVRQNIDGYDVYSCNGTFYQAYNGQYVVVYIE